MEDALDNLESLECLRRYCEPRPDLAHGDVRCNTDRLGQLLQGAGPLRADPTSKSVQYGEARSDGERPRLPALGFDERGVSVEENQSQMARWLTEDTDLAKSKEADDLVKSWFDGNWKACGALKERVVEKLKGLQVTKSSLYGKPVVRLVHNNQLQYDLDNRIVYQLTPAQIRMERSEPDAEDLLRIQLLYRNLPRGLQSLLAVFDSDLGKDGGTENHSKELLFVEPSPPKAIAVSPSSLNYYSSLRYWAPVPSFVASVFHLLFWRPVLRGSDLYGRHVISAEDQDKWPNTYHGLMERAACYRLAINTFHGAVFHVADYGDLFSQLWEIARWVESDDSKTSLIMKDSILRQVALARADHERRRQAARASYVVKYALPEIRLRLTESKKPLELLMHYPGYRKDRKRATLAFLRDKCLEVIAWSLYQAEIRSNGMVPVQRLYAVALEEAFAKRIFARGGKQQQVKHAAAFLAKALQATGGLNKFVKLERKLASNRETLDSRGTRAKQTRSVDQNRAKE
ncbi:MAG: hypothetical protein IPK26_16755 [Planctomycetes bacterium]|nr:hypothetical protein [Planctomycetota bacterium]